MRALTHFSLLAIAFLVVARPRANERRYAVSGPGEEAASFVAANSIPQDITKRNSEAPPKEARQPFSHPWLPKKRDPEAEPKTVVGAFSVAGTAPRDIERRVLEAEPKILEPPFTATDSASQDTRKRSPEAQPKEIDPSFAPVDSASQDFWKRSSEAEPTTVEPSFAAAGGALDTIMGRSPNAGPEHVDLSFASVELPQRVAPRFSKARKESEFYLF